MKKGVFKKGVFVVIFLLAYTCYAVPPPPPVPDFGDADTADEIKDEQNVSVEDTSVRVGEAEPAEELEESNPVVQKIAMGLLGAMFIATVIMYWLRKRPKPAPAENQIAARMSQYIQENLNKGYSEEQIRAALRKKYPDDVINRGFSLIR